MIPRIIHYCWFGRTPKNDLIQNCIASWQKFFPEFEIIEWNEENIDINNHEFMRICYEERKWAYVADYARLLALKEYGGIYFDTDMEIIKSFPKKLFNYDFFAGEEVAGQVSCGIIGANPNNPTISELIDYYDQIILLEPIPVLLKEILVKQAKMNAPNYYIAEPEIFYPKKYSGEIGTLENSLTIHHWEGSWKKEKNTFFSNFIKKRKCDFSEEEEDLLINIQTSELLTTSELKAYEKLIQKHRNTINDKLKMNLENKFERHKIAYINNTFIDPQQFSVTTIKDAINNPYLKGFPFMFFVKIIIKGLINLKKVNDRKSNSNS